MPDTSLRGKLNDAAGWVMAGCGLVAVIVITAVMSSVENGIAAGLLFVGLMCGAFCATLVHELGHAIGAWLAGWRVWIVSVLGVVWRRGHGIRLSTKYSQDVGGYVLACPPSAAHDSKWRSIAFTAGGPLASVLAGPPVIALLFAMPEAEWRTTPIGEAIGVSIFAFGAASCLAAMATLWPSRNREGRGNDMVMILDALFKRDPSAEVRGASWAWGMFDFGMAPNEWPRWLHDSVTKSALNPWVPPLAPLLTFLLALEANDEAAARDTARRSTHPLGRLMRAYVSAYFDNDAAAAQSELINLAVGPRDPSLLILHALVRARIAALTGDARGARRAYDAISDDLYEDLPRPYWTRLLKTVAP